jgi:hypothetical protein
MLLNISKLSIASLALISASALASSSYADFSQITDPETDNFNSFSVLSSGVTVSVTGWSDTANFSDAEGGNPLSGDDKITQAVDFDQHPLGGWAMTNLDERNTNNCGYHHSADNLGSDCGFQDYDMFLIEFSEAVNLSSATYAWNIDGTSNNQVTVAALNDENLLGENWLDVANNQTIASGYSQMEDISATSGYYVNEATRHLSNFDENSESNTSGVYSNFWLIGALNTVFGGDESLEGDDGFKISGVSFSTDSTTTPPATTVPEPTSIMMFGLALVGFAASRRKTK